MNHSKFDKRLIERNLRKGQLTPEEYQAHLAALPDASDNVDVVEAQIESILNKDGDEPNTSDDAEDQN